MSATVYLNGRFQPEREAVVSVYDGGWLHGAGLFETMRAENRRVFRLESHMDRLRRSAAALLAPLDEHTLPTPDVFRELMERNDLNAARVRLTLTAGSVRGAAASGPAEPTVCITANELAGHPTSAYENGVAAIVCGHRISPSDPTAGHKTTNYLPRLLGLREAQRSQCTEALWFTTGNRLAEGCISNVLVATRGTLKTPPLDTPVLQGIARGVVLHIARQIGIETVECPLTIEDVLEADELLLTSTMVQVLPVIRLERHDIGGGRVGPVARKLREEYQSLVRTECGG